MTHQLKPFEFIFTTVRKEIEAGFSLLREYREDKTRAIRGLGGERLLTLNQHYAEVYRYLDSSSACARAAALLLIRERWLVGEDACDKLLTLALGDPDVVVRGLAWWCICYAYKCHGVEASLYGKVCELFRECLGLGDRCDMKELIESWIGTIGGLCEQCDFDQRAKDDQDAFTSQLAGESLGVMLQDPSKAIGFLESGTPRFRAAAIRVLRYHWPLTPEVADRFRQIMQADADWGVRIAAIGAFGEYYRKRNNCEARAL